MINWAARTGYFHNCPLRSQVGPVTTQMNVGGNGYTKIAPGDGGQLRCDMICPAPGEVEGNPDLIPRITYLQGATASDPHYAGVFRYTSYEDSGIRSARVLQGKTVTLSWNLRCPSGSPSDVSVRISLIVWRGNCNVPPQYRTDPWGDTSQQLWSDSVKEIHGGPIMQRLDFTFLLPQIAGFVPDSPGDPESYLGIGFDIIGASGVGGGVLDIGTYQLNEGGPKPIEEQPR